MKRKSYLANKKFKKALFKYLLNKVKCKTNKSTLNKIKLKEPMLVKTNKHKVSKQINYNIIYIYY